MFWLEKVLYLGEVIHDYGCVSEVKRIASTEKTEALHCRRNGQEYIILRITVSGWFGFYITYSYLSFGAIESLRKVLSDIASPTEAA